MSDSPGASSADPITAILVAVTEIKGDVKSALANQARHEQTLGDHGRMLTDHGARIGVLEAVDQRDTQNEQRTYSGRVVLLTALGAAIALGGVLTPILLALAHGGS